MKDKEHVVYVCVYTHNGILPIKNNEIMPFTATWMDLEVIILSKGSQIKTTHDIVYMRNLKKNDINKLTYKTETDSQT